MKTRSLLALGLVSLAIPLLWGCGSTPAAMAPEEKTRLNLQVQSCVEDFKKADPTMDKFFTTCYAYAVFPDVGTGAIVVGGAHGRGEVYKNGILDGYADISKASVGAQLGAQSFEQIVFFQNGDSYATFTGGTLQLDATLNAVAASNGASTSANYQKGVVVFTVAKGGLMASAAVGGQKFRYIALDQTK